MLKAPRAAVMTIASQKRVLSKQTKTSLGDKARIEKN
jgi:hypothetical protein